MLQCYQKRKQLFIFETKGDHYYYFIKLELIGHLIIRITTFMQKL